MKYERLVRTLRRGAVSMAALGLLMPRLTCGADPCPVMPITKTSVSLATDVALSAAGTLVGQVVNRNGVPLANVDVAIITQGQVAARTTTDAEGRFTASGLQGGIHQIETSQGSKLVRLWAPRTAPPAAQPGALVVAGEQIVRGNVMDNLGFMSSPWVLGGVVAAAIAIPLALDNGDAS